MKTIQPVMIRYHSGSSMCKPEVVIFLPDYEANHGMIVCYAHIGQHSEASMAYYYETIPLHAAPPKYQQQGAELVEEYKSICAQANEKLVLVKRDSAAFREARYNWMERVAVC